MPTERTERFRLNLASMCDEYGRSSEIAEAAGVSRTHLWRVANGKAVPSLELAMRIAEALHLPINDLLFTDLTATAKV